MKFTATNRKLRQLLLGFHSTLIPRPEFQRRLVWTNKDKLSFIDTVLNGYPFPEIYIASGEVDTTTGEGKELLVDGQQRLTTLYQYFKGLTELHIPKGFPKYIDLEDDQKKAFLEYIVVVRDLGPMELPEIINIFSRINSTSYSLTAMEMHNARYDGALKKFAQHMASNPFFYDHKVFTPTNIRRMQDLVFTLSITISFLSTYFNRDSEIEKFLSKYNESFSRKEEVKSRFEDAFELIEEMDFSQACRVWKKADIFTLICEIDRALHKKEIKIDEIAVSKRLNLFYDQVNDVRGIQTPNNTIEMYYKASVQATNDRKNRIIRGEIIQEIIDLEYTSEFIETDDSHIPNFEEMKNEMRTWFFRNYENPVEQCPYESKEGGYIYIHGGPYDAREELFNKFWEQYPNEVIEELAQELEETCWEWSGISHGREDSDY